jgi:hypothetical protein
MIYNQVSNAFAYSVKDNQQQLWSFKLPQFVWMFQSKVLL